MQRGSAKAIKGQQAKPPYTIAMKDGKPFRIGAIWENWKEPASGEWIRPFALITTNANELGGRLVTTADFRLLTKPGPSIFGVAKRDAASQHQCQFAAHRRPPHCSFNLCAYYCAIGLRGVSSIMWA